MQVTCISKNDNYWGRNLQICLSCSCIRMLRMMRTKALFILLCATLALCTHLLGVCIFESQLVKHKGISSEVCSAQITEQLPPLVQHPLKAPAQQVRCVHNKGQHVITLEVHLHTVHYPNGTADSLAVQIASCRTGKLSLLTDRWYRWCLLLSNTWCLRASNTPHAVIILLVLLEMLCHVPYLVGKKGNCSHIHSTTLHTHMVRCFSLALLRHLHNRCRYIELLCCRAQL